MKRYIAIDSGKFATKVAEYNPQTKKITKFSIRTKVADGDFRDDAIEAQTVIAQIGDTVYKVGNGARGNGAQLETNKQSDVHKICTLTALGVLASRNEEDEINVAIMLPAKDWANVSKRMDYKNYMLPEGKFTMSVKNDNKSPVTEKSFTIKNRYVFPESIGALFMDGVIDTITPTSITGVLDVGNLNLNATLWQGTELLQDKSATAELGGAILIQELAQELTTNVTACDEMIVANILKSENRKFPEGNNLTPEQLEESKAIIGRVLKSHADKIKRCCHQRNWSLDVTKIIAIGGTSADIKDELLAAFGNITILEDSSYCNVLGALRMMCAREKEINEIIPFNFK